ncbi:histone deacetylase [Neisseriaceae bacterium JH1-16]|nr:histone deacetylase [Neisseriaceae bacterium JH1-16]
MNIYRTDRFVLPLPDGHRFPAEKYALLAERVTEFAAGELVEPDAATEAELALAHTPDYVARVLGGTLSAAEQREIGLPWSAQLAERSRRSVGGTIAAARSALHDGLSVHLAGGTHHAYADKGSGFCVFNDVAVAARLMLAEGRVRRVLVIDLDVHQGNGTAAIFAGDERVFTFSMHGEKNFPFRKVASSRDVELPDDCDDAAYLAALDAELPALFAAQRPDLVFYLAGADAYRGDRLGRLALSMEGLWARDARVLDACERAHAALAVTMAGGYARPIADTVTIHAGTVREVWRRASANPVVTDSF